MDCLFCNIAQGHIPATIIYRDAQVCAFADINPQAPQHFLIIPQKHIATLNDLDMLAGDGELVGQMTLAAKTIATEHALHEAGYRLVLNCGAGAGQTVFHLHMHLLGGRTLTWPPG